MELHDAEEAMGITKIYAHDIMMTDKESTNQGEQLLDFYGFSWNYPGPKSPHGNFSSGFINLKIFYMQLRFQILCIDRFFFFFFKKRLLWQKIY